MWLEDVQALVRRGLLRHEPWPTFDEVLPEADYLRLMTALIDEASARARPRSRKDLIREDLVEEWVTRGDGREFARILLMRLLDSGLVEPNAPAARFGVEHGIRLALELSESEKESASASVLKSVVQGIGFEPNRLFEDPASYAHELRLLRGGTATPIGRVLSSLSGRRAIEWLLVAENLQSGGPSDPWRTSEETVRSLIDRPRRVVMDHRWSEEEQGRVDFPHSWKGLLRLERLGLLELSPDESSQTYSVHPTGLAILKEVLSPESPLRGIAGALLKEDVSEFAGVGLRRTSDGATEWVIQTVAHGLRNALGPLPFLIERAVEGAPTEADREILARISGGVQRAFKLVGDLVDLYHSSRAPAEPFDLAMAVKDAVAAANGTGVSWRAEAQDSMTVRGHRPRLVHGLVDLLRNARHHPRPGTPLRVELELGRVEDAFVLWVDDSGTGVSPELRKKIFDAGFTTRPAGTGLGLTLLRDVVEGEFGGTVDVGDSPLGGARFILRFPRMTGG